MAPSVSICILPQAAADGAFAEEADIERREGKKKRKEGKKLDLLEEVLWQKFPPPSPPPPLKLGAKVFFLFFRLPLGEGERAGLARMGAMGGGQRRRQGEEDIYGTRKGGIPFSLAGAEGNFEKTLPQKSRYPLLAFSYPFFSRKCTRLFSRIREMYPSFLLPLFIVAA